MSDKISGGCLCGAVRYETAVQPVIVGNCHCRDCQRSSGSAYSPTLFVPETSVSIIGQVNYYTSKGDSGKDVHRGFCPTCGSQLFGKVALMPGLLSIRAGTLDDPAQYKPAVDIYTSRVQPWDFMSPDTVKFPFLPPPMPTA